MKLLILVFSSYFFISGCSLMPEKGRAYLNPQDLERKNNELDDKVKKQKGLVTLYEANAAGTNRPAVLREYIDTTININRKACLAHLRQAAYNNTHRKFYRSEVASTGVFSAAVMGATKVDPTGIAATASLFAYLESTLDNYESAYKINSEELLINLVTAKYTEMELNIWQKSSSTYTEIDTIDNIERADLALDEHQYLCTFEGLMALVRESLKAQSETIEANAKTKHNLQ